MALCINTNEIVTDFNDVRCKATGVSKWIQLSEHLNSSRLWTYECLNEFVKKNLQWMLTKWKFLLLHQKKNNNANFKQIFNWRQNIEAKNTPRSLSVRPGSSYKIINLSSWKSSVNHNFISIIENFLEQAWNFFGCKT